MAIEFFWTPGGPFALRCLMALAAKNLPFDSKQLDLSKGENRSPKFLALSPNGTLPVLRDGSTIVRESQAIVFYLDRAYPEVPLYGTNPSEAGQVMQELCEQQSYADPALMPLIGALRFGRTITNGDLTAALSRFTDLLEIIDRRLNDRGWLVGTRMTAADINLYPLVHSVVEAMASDRARELGLTRPDLNRFFRLISWMQEQERFADQCH